MLRPCYVACMHAWQPARLAAVFAEVERAGLTRSDIARVAGVHRSQVSRWFSGEQRPGYDKAMRVAGYLQKEHPELAERFTAAAGYGGPVEPEPGPDIPPNVLDWIEHTVAPAKQPDLMTAIHAALSGYDETGEDPAAGESEPGRRAG